MTEYNRYAYSVIEVARRVAEGATGSGAPVLEAYRTWLRWRISPDVWTWDGKRTSYDRAVLQLALEALLLHDSKVEAKPSCGTCPGEHQALMILCATCGNKRCPKAADHKNECSGSNEPGQKGSAYE